MKIEKEKIQAEKVVFGELEDQHLVSTENTYERIIPVQTDNLEFSIIIEYSDYYNEGDMGEDNNYFLKRIMINDDEMEKPIFIPPLNELGKYTFMEWLEKELSLYLVSNYEIMADEENKYSREYVQDLVNKIIEKLKKILDENDIDY